MEIRKMLQEDTENVGIIYEKAFEKHNGFIKYYPKFDDYIKFCIEGGYAYIASEGNVVCGALLAYEKPDMAVGKSLYIELLAVSPEFQRKGIGTKLLNHAKREAQSYGIGELSLRTGCYLDSYEIYKRYGFVDSRSDHRFMFMNIN